MEESIFSERANTFILKVLGLQPSKYSEYVLEHMPEAKEVFYELGELISDDSEDNRNDLQEFFHKCTVLSNNPIIFNTAQLLIKYAWKFRQFGLLHVYTTANPLQREPMPWILGSLYDEMDNKEKKVYNELPDVITIYRGTSLEEYQFDNYSQSWTLCKEKAEFFAYKYNQFYKGTERVVVKATIRKKNIYAYTNMRDEEECIVNPWQLDEVELVSQGLLKESAEIS